MKSAIFLLLLSVLLASCTASAQTSINDKPKTDQKAGSCLTAAPVCQPIEVASNIKINAASVVATFDGYDIYLGKTWNCLAVYEGDDLLYFGDQDHFWLDETTFVITGGDIVITIDIPAGIGSMREPGNLYHNLNKAKYNGKPAEYTFGMFKRAN